MKPLTGWPRKGSVLPLYPTYRPWELWFRSIAEAVSDACDEWRYHSRQELLTDMYRHGTSNIGLTGKEVQAIQWMAGTPQFLDHSGLQIVPMTDEQKAELELWLEKQRMCRLTFYQIPIPDPTPYKPDLDRLG